MFFLFKKAETDPDKYTPLDQLSLLGYKGEDYRLRSLYNMFIATIHG